MGMSRGGQSVNGPFREIETEIDCICIHSIGYAAFIDIFYTNDQIFTSMVCVSKILLLAGWLWSNLKRYFIMSQQTNRYCVDCLKQLL